MMKIQNNGPEGAMFSAFFKAAVLSGVLILSAAANSISAGKNPPPPPPVVPFSMSAQNVVTTEQQSQILRVLDASSGISNWSFQSKATYTGLALGDVDGIQKSDGSYDNEVVAGLACLTRKNQYQYFINVYKNGVGEIYPGFPGLRYTNFYSIADSVIDPSNIVSDIKVGEIDSGHAGKEIVLTTTNHLAVFEVTTGVVLKKADLNFTAQKWRPMAVAIGDIDGDQANEILLTVRDFSGTSDVSRLVAYNYSNNQLFPTSYNTEITSLFGNYGCLTELRTGNVDGNTKLDLWFVGILLGSNPGMYSLFGWELDVSDVINKEGSFKLVTSAPIPLSGSTKLDVGKLTAVGPDVIALFESGPSGAQLRVYGFDVNTKWWSTSYHPLSDNSYTMDTRGGVRITDNEIIVAGGAGTFTATFSYLEALTVDSSYIISKHWRNIGELGTYALKQLVVGPLTVPPNTQ